METVVADNLKSFCKNKDSQRGASLLEILLSIGIVTLVSPFVYSQISDTMRDIQDVSTAKKIVNSRGNALNFLRKNQDKWPEIAQIKLSDEELAIISDFAHAGYIDKYYENGDIKIEVYLSFKIDDTILHATKVAKNIGFDAAAAQTNNIAYGDYWATSAPEFNPGDVIYHIDYDFNSDDISGYLHRTGEDDLNIMQRDLNMGKFNIYNVGTAFAESEKSPELNTAFINSENANASNIFFAKGANINGDNIEINLLKVNGDITGFRDIYTKTLNNSGYYGSGNIITDSATINKSVNVGKDLTIKSANDITISGFTGIATHVLYLPYLNTDVLTFYNNFGLTVSGELLQSNVAPIQLGSWSFPNTTPPSFSSINFTRAAIPAIPSSNEFKTLMSSGWKDAQ